MLALFVVYVILANLRSTDDIRELVENPDTVKPSPIQETLSGIRHKWRDARGLEWQDVRTAEGPKAVCGQRVTAHYTLFSAGGQILRATRDEGKPETFVIGQGDVIPALEQVALGMTVGSARSFAAPSYLAFDAPGFAREGVAAQTAISGEVELLAVSPSLPESEMPLKVFDTAVPSRQVALTCGQTVDASLTVWNYRGDAVFPAKGESGEMTVRLGSGQWPFWLESGLIGAGIGTVRTLIVPPAYVGVILGQRGDAAKRLDFDGEGLILVEVRVKQLHPEPTPQPRTTEPTQKEQP